VTAQPAIESFVIRLYQNVLGRNHDAGGLQYWSSMLKVGVTGAAVAYEFFFSPEFQNRKTSDAVFVDIMYRTLLNRNLDTAGMAHWTNQLRVGLPRDFIFAGFVNSAEFTNICRSYGIVRGNYTPPPGGMARVFAMRLYREALEREPDQQGLNYWHNVLLGGVSGTAVAYEFIFSYEMTYIRKLSNAHFVEVLYKALLGRASDAPGKAYWVGLLNSGISRQDLFYAFASSTEFGTICEVHGVRR